MKDYHQRFKERFIREDDGLLGIGKYDTEEVLAFIDEVVSETRKYDDETTSILLDDLRCNLIEKVEDWRVGVTPLAESLSAGMTQAEAQDINTFATAYNQALDDILTYLQGESREQSEWESIGKSDVYNRMRSESPKETECCEKCRSHTGLTRASAIPPYCMDPDCRCHT